MKQFFTSKQEWALCFVTMVWGMTFLVIRYAMQECGPFFFVGLRFFVAFSLLACASLRIAKEVTKEEIVWGIVLGIIVYLGFGLQTAGLVTIEAAKSAFLTAFYIPLVPFFEVLFLHRKLCSKILVGMLLSFPGVLLIAWPEKMSLGFGIGEIETIICAVVFACEILVVGLVAPRCNARRLVAIEVFVTSLCSFLTMPFVQEPLPNFTFVVCGCALFLGLVSACMQTILTWAQKSVASSRATLIYAGEPVWAGLFGYLAGESITWLAVFGGILVLCGVVVSRQ